MASKKVLPPTYLFSSIVLMILLHFFLPLTILISYPWSLSGLVPLSLGIAFNLIADKQFTRFNTTVKPFQESSALITTGIFRISRHPMYFGMILILLGLAALMGSLSPFFVIPVFLAMLNIIFVQVEERMLADKFGESWVEYKSEVRKWI